MMDLRDKQELLEAINNSHEVAYRAYQSLFENSVRGFSSQLAQFEERNNVHHKEIKDKQDITNGRVARLERETTVFRWVHKNPYTAAVISIILLCGIISVVMWVGIENVLKIIST